MIGSYFEVPDPEGAINELQGDLRHSLNCIQTFPVLTHSYVSSMGKVPAFIQFQKVHWSPNNRSHWVIGYLWNVMFPLVLQCLDDKIPAFWCRRHGAGTQTGVDSNLASSISCLCDLSFTALPANVENMGADTEIHTHVTLREWT